MLIAASSFLVLTGCGSSSSNPSPSHANLAIRSLQTGGTNTMMYVQYKLEGSAVQYLNRVGGNFDSYQGQADTTMNVKSPTGRYTFRVWYPEVTQSQPWVGDTPKGQTHVDLLVNGQVKASLDLDAARPHFENDTCSRTVTVQVN